MDAYSQDLREKIVQALSGRSMGKSEAARTFGVSLSSVKRHARAASEGRSLAPKKRPGSKPKLDESARRLLSADLEERPFVTLSERGEYLEALTGISVSDSTVCRELKRMEQAQQQQQMFQQQAQQQQQSFQQMAQESMNTYMQMFNIPHSYLQEGMRLAQQDTPGSLQERSTGRDPKEDQYSRSSKQSSS